MAALATVLTEFATSGNSRTSTTAGHTAQRPKLVIERRVVAEGKKTLAESSVKVIHATVDAEGLLLREKVQFEVIVKTPIAGQADDVAAALVIFRDVVQSTEFGATVTTQNWLK